MKKSLSIFLVVVMLILSISIIPTSAGGYVNNTPKSYWCGSDATGFYLTINPVKNTNLKYRVFYNYSKTRYGQPSNWIAVADYTLSKAKKVHVTLPSSIRKLNTVYIKYTVRTWTKNSAGKTVYTSGFAKNNPDIQWNRFYKVKSAYTSSRNGVILYLPYYNGIKSTYHSRWYIFIKNSAGKWITVGTTTQNNYLLSESVLKKYTVNNKASVTIREYDYNNRLWMGGYCNPAVSIVKRNGKFIPTVVNTPVI